MYGRVVRKDRLDHVTFDRRKLGTRAKRRKRTFQDCAHDRMNSSGTSRVIGPPTTHFGYAPHTLCKNCQQLLLTERLEES